MAERCGAVSRGTHRFLALLNQETTTFAERSSIYEFEAQSLPQRPITSVSFCYESNGKITREFNEEMGSDGFVAAP